MCPSLRGRPANHVAACQGVAQVPLPWCKLFPADPRYVLGARFLECRSSVARFYDFWNDTSYHEASQGKTKRACQGL